MLECIFPQFQPKYITLFTTFGLHRTIIYLVALAHLGCLQLFSSAEFRVLALYQYTQSKVLQSVWRAIFITISVIWTVCGIYRLWEAAEKGDEEALFQRKLEFASSKMVQSLYEAFLQIMVVELVTSTALGISK